MAEMGIKRQLILSEFVNQGSVGRLISGIREINAEDDIKEAKEVGYDRAKRPIELVINSGGGSVYSGFGLIGAMELSKTPVHTICLGAAFSMALAIFLSGHVRIAHRFSSLMYHQISSLADGKMQEIKQDLEEMERLQLLYDQLVLDTSNVLPEKLESVQQQKDDWYISVEEAVRLGMVDQLYTTQ